MASERIVNDGHCFGCGRSNERGLKLAFRRTGNGSVECEYVAAEALAGAPGVVHGGIQAALLDEVLGMAAHVDGEDPAFSIVTVDFRLRYRRPVPTGAPLLARGRLLRVEGRDYFLEGEILGPDGKVSTRAEARWRRIDLPPS